jgi:hypothetical protein
MTTRGDVARIQPAPLWAGPNGAGPNGGVTQGLVLKFLACRERFRVYAMEGLRPADVWDYRMGYGSMWHVCEEAFAKGWGKDANVQILTEYAQDLCRRYPTQQYQIYHWYNVCRAQFPVYVEYWKNHPDVTERAPLLQEYAFDVPYALPSGRTVRLRGRWDAVDLVGTGDGAGIYLFETKTKGDVNTANIERQLKWDLQTGLYLTALQVYGRRHPLRDEARAAGAGASVPLSGVRYNVIRRPLSGGRGSIRQHKGSKNVPAETPAQFYARLAGIIRSEPESYFYRWKVDVTPDDLKRFRRECLDPILEQMYDWWEWVSFITARGGSVWDNDVTYGASPDQEDNGRHPSAIHWRSPANVYNTVGGGGADDVDEYLATGSRVGLTGTSVLFPELAEGP